MTWVKIFSMAISEAIGILDLKINMMIVAFQGLSFLLWPIGNALHSGVYPSLHHLQTTYVVREMGVRMRLFTLHLPTSLQEVKLYTLLKQTK